MEKLLVVISVLVIVALVVALQGWIIMLLAGALGHIFGIKELYISFWDGVVVGFALTVIGANFKKN